MCQGLFVSVGPWSGSVYPLTCGCHETGHPERPQHWTPCQTETPAALAVFPRWPSNHLFSPRRRPHPAPPRSCSQVESDITLWFYLRGKITHEGLTFFTRRRLVLMCTFHVLHHVVVLLPHRPFWRVVLNYFLILFFNLFKLERGELWHSTMRLKNMC